LFRLLNQLVPPAISPFIPIFPHCFLKMRKSMEGLANAKRP
jgi:hypothetical protein